MLSTSRLTEEVVVADNEDVFVVEGVIGSVVEAVFNETGTGAAVSTTGAVVFVLMVLVEGTTGEIVVDTSLEISLEVGIVVVVAVAAAAAMGAEESIAEAILSLRGCSVL